MRIQRGGQGVRTPPLEKSQNYRFSWQYWSGSPVKRQTTKPAFNVWPPSARQRNAILMAFRWWADDGRFIAVFGSFIPHQLKKKSNLDPL